MGCNFYCRALILYSELHKLQMYKKMLCEIVAGSYNKVVAIVISAEELGIFSKLWK